MQKTIVRLLCRLTGFALLLAVLVAGLDAALFDDSTVIPAWRAVRSGSTEQVDVLFAGNSHTYASVDESVLSQALGKNVQLLRCSSANGGIVAAMLEAYVHYTAPEIVVLECNPFMVDNYAVMRGDLRGVVYQSFDGIPGYWEKAKALSAVMDAEHVPAGVFQLFRPTAMWSRWQRGDGAQAAGYEPYHHFTFQRDYAASELEDYYRIPEDQPAQGALLAANQQALERIIELSEELDFEIWMIVAPVAHYAEGYRQDMRRLYAVSQSCERITLFDNGMQQLSAIGLTAGDFADAGHLNRRGAQKYTRHVLGLLAGRYGIQPDTASVLAYQNESAVRADGAVRLEMECWGDALYQFCYNDGAGRAVESGFSAENAITLPEGIAPETVTVQMKLKSDPDGKTISVAFMEEKEP